MKEKGPEFKTSKFRKEAKYAGITVAVFAVVMAVSAAIGKIARVVDPPEEKYRISIKTKEPKNEGDQLEIEVKLIKQCIDAIVFPAPSPFAQTFYKDCE